MRIGYNTNGFAHHRLDDAINILADMGYCSIAITLDHHALNPYAEDFPQQRKHIAELLERFNLHSVIETGSRFLLDPRQKHSPTLLDQSAEGRARRSDFLQRAIDLARDLRSDAVSFWSGSIPSSPSRRAGTIPVQNEQLLARLNNECSNILTHAEKQNVRLAFEPEPGMFIDTMARFAELHQRVNHPLFGLTLDVGHVHCIADGNIEDHIAAWRDHLFNIHIEDMKQGTHEHLMFGKGEMSFPPILAALRRIDYQHGIHVELPRQSHNAVETARQSYDFIQHATQQQ